MTEPALNEKLRILRAGILADSVTRATAWCAWLAIMGALVVPLAIRAWRERGAAAGFAVFILCAALAWHVKPRGRSLAAQCRNIE